MDAAVEQVRPLCEAVRLHGSRRAGPSGGPVRRRRDHLASGSRAEALAAALAALDPDAPGQPRGVRRAGCASPARPSCPRDVATDVVTRRQVTQRNVPVDRVGLYVPAAKAPLISSVLMNVVPAQVAGVASLALASPAQREHGGLPHPSILAACALLGIDEVYAAGGAGAVAMFAYGYHDLDDETPGCRPVDLVTGPANIYGVAAKRLLRGVVGIDSEAGPTEIAILADDSADPVVRRRRPDQPGRARPDGGERPGDSVGAARRRGRGASSSARSRRPSTPSGSARRSPGGSRRSCWSTTSTRARTVVNALRRRAPRDPHRDAATRAARIRNAGAVFVGPYAPVSLGDYAAGSNHVLPTGGLRVPLVGSVGAHLPQDGAGHRLLRDALADVAPHVLTLSDAEDLPAHGDAVRIRLECDDAPDASAPPLRPELVGHRAVRRAAARRRRCGSTSTRTRTRPSPEVVAAMADGRRDGRSSAQPLPRPRGRPRCARRWRRTSVTD